MRRKMIVVLFVLFSILPANQSYCTGIPVFDGSNLINQLKDFLQQLAQYEESISQTSKLSSQYAQMIEDYKQVLREYSIYLEQIESIQHMIDEKDWKAILRTIEFYREKSKRAVIIRSNPNDSDFEENMDVILGEYGHVPQNPNDVETEARALGIWSDEYAAQVQRDWEHYELYKDRLRTAAKNDWESKKRINETIPKHSRILDNLGDASDLATLQSMAAQNQTMLKQMESLIQIQNQILTNMESEQARRAAQSAEWRKRERERLKNRKPTKLLGRDRWGSF